ncbi:helix-turn-helix domain-containing protein [Solihabitans fulvus]|uniref:helix-turn-helix domain-containing protein n=1 Tax=Solihabitans fulvus TaxID=1892852 RepID=UPI001CB7651C|nr:helix-turn-helix transcriptional regulator [Solihabitans fulvus]
MGLDSVTEGVYRLLLTRADLGVLPIAQRLGVGEGEVRDALDRLVDLALLRQSVQNPGTLRAVSPEAGLQLLLQRQQSDLLRRQQEVLESQHAISRMVTEFADLRQGESTPLGERLVGVDAVVARLEEFAATTASSACALIPGALRSEVGVEASIRNDRTASARGVVIRTVFMDSVRNDALTHRYARALTDAGGEVRTVPTLPLRILLLDAKVALVPIDPADTSAGAVVLHGRGAVAALVALFEQTWDTACPFGADRPRDEVGLTRQERELLLLLAQGMTDEAAGKRLNISLRTVRRVMSDLMERLGARSRFEAGLRAGERGWL